ncbi:hypothetical protein CBER1_03220 [Cercospora berteroae]|uniref:Heterokaryon incompatibility domain-containing protein n=1 Tax=Cercospora berteroae TaxID=357750 RepID=A0A2S6CL99_9PEZI|nr:hypothetical protein CBER1_03220 [Cercospora berteroae]
MDWLTTLLKPRTFTFTRRFVHDPLPGPRWVRVLVLQPASNLRDPLVGFFEIVFLGEPLPLEPTKSNADAEALTAEYLPRRAHYEQVMSSRKLHYDALSYTWATKDGDTSLSHSILLDGRRLDTTRNLAEGLRRLRSCTTSKQLGADAICINQSHPIERSEQVAMMYDIYRLARNVDVWLGEGTHPEDGYIAWQFTRCIYDQTTDKDRKLSHAMQAKAAEVFLETEIDHCRPSRIMPPLTGTIAQPDYESPSADFDPYDFLDLGDALDDWFFADARNLPRLVARLEIFMRLFERRYWKRRWVVQENCSRGPGFDTRVFYWGEYSADNASILAALSMARSVIAERIGDVRFALSPVEFYAVLTSRVLSIVDPDRAKETDLLEKVIVFQYLQCGDPRDRLYSLYSLVSGHHLEADYTATLETASVRFARVMVETGDMRVLYHAGDANNGHSIALPTWVPDLRGYHGRCVNTLKSVMADTHYCINADLNLTLEMYWIGHIVEGRSVKHWQVREEDWHDEPWRRWKGHVSRNGVSLHVELEFETLQPPVAGVNDVLCMLDLLPSGSRFLWLRRVEPFKSTYKLVVSGYAVMEEAGQFGGRVPSKLFEFLIDHTESVKESKISVIIV